MRQYWSRAPSPTDALTGYPRGGLGLVDPDIPGQVFADEIDPAWADNGSDGQDGDPISDGSGPGQDHGQVT